MHYKRLASVLDEIRNGKGPISSFTADNLVGAIRSGVVHIITFDAPESPDSVDRLADMKRAHPGARRA